MWVMRHISPFHPSFCGRAYLVYVFLALSSAFIPQLVLKLGFSALTHSRVDFCQRVCAAVRIFIPQTCIIYSQKGYTVKAAGTTIRSSRGFDVDVFPDWASALHVATSRVHVMDEVWKTTIRRAIIHPAATIPVSFYTARCCGRDNNDALYGRLSFLVQE